MTGAGATVSASGHPRARHRPVAPPAADRLGGHAVAEQLAACGAQVAFCVPGESYLAVLDGLFDFQDQIRLITTRHEGGAAMMAAAYGRLTGRPGICLVTRGPGATNASIGLHIASQDAVPMILLVGQVPTTQQGRRAFQEVDYRSMLQPLAKAVLEVTTPHRIPEFIARAHHLSVTGECGPVVVVLPEDVLDTPTDAPLIRATQPARGTPSPQQLEDFQAALAAAERPIIIAGGSGWTAQAARALREFAEASGTPVASAFRQQDVLDNASSAYVGALGLHGTPGLEHAVDDADLVALIGTRPDAVTSRNFTLPDARRQRVLHIHPEPAVLNQLHPAQQSIVAGPTEFVTSLAPPATGTAPSTWLRRLRDNFLHSGQIPGDEDPRPSQYMDVLNAHVPADCIMTCGAGTYTAWIQRHRRYTTFPSQVAPQAGAMGYGLPAAIAAKLVYPQRAVVAFAGDGCLLMTGQELATAIRYGLDILIVVVNNSSYGAIRNHQQARFPGRAIATDLINPDFTGWARSFGAHAERVSTPQEFAVALRRSRESGTATLIEIVHPNQHNDPGPGQPVEDPDLPMEVGHA